MASLWETGTIQSGIGNSSLYLSIFLVLPSGIRNLEKDSANEEPPPETIPNEADFLLGYATIPGFVSYRSRSMGSWYITKLCEMLDKYASK